MLTVLEDQLEAARRLLPEPVYEYYRAGAGDEVTTDEAGAAWASFRVRPKPLRDVSKVDLSTELLGLSLRTPLLVAPMAFHLLAHPRGELATSAGADEAGALCVVSTRASFAFEEIAASTGAPWWFQVYVMKDRDLTARLVERAVASGARDLVLTGDTPYVGRKRRVGAVRIPLPDDHFLVNISRHVPNGSDGRAAAAQDPAIGLETIDWLNRLSGLPVVVKGVLRGDSAVECLDAGAAAVIVSNHGGRQLDRGISSALALGEVCAAVAGRAPVLVDGGVRSGLDLFIALALGARAALIGRPVLWGLACSGSDGVRDTLTAVLDDLEHVMALAGTPGVGAIDNSFVTAL